MKKLFFVLSFLLFYSFNHAQDVGLDWAYNVGGTGWDLGQAIQTGPNGNIYAAGLFEGNMDIDPGPGTLNLSTTTGFQEIFVKKVDPNGDLLWAHQVATGTFGDSLTGKILDVDASGNLYLTGKYSGTVDFDPGPNTFNLTAGGQGGSIFILKLDAAGDFLWATSTGGNSYQQVSAISVDPSGNVFCTGTFYGTVDFDPGTGTSNLTANNQGLIFIQKLDASGNYLWAESLGNTNYKVAYNGQADNQGNIVLTGTFSGTMDFDPGTGTFNQTSFNSSQDVFVVKLDGAGDFQWASYIETAGYDYRAQSAVDAAGNIYMSGTWNGSANFNPGASPTSLTSSNNGQYNDGYIQKLNAQGAFQWVRQFSSSTTNYSYMDPGSLTADASGNSYVAGYYQGDIDFDPGTGVDVQSTGNTSKNFVIKLNSTGDYVWGRPLDSPNYMLFNDMVVDGNENLYMTGGFNQSLDFDPGPGTFTLTPTTQSSDIVVVKWSQNACSSLAAVIDSTLDVSCASSGFASGFATGGQAPYTYAWNTTPVATDTFASFTTGGIYEFTVSDANGCSRTSNFLIGGPTNITGQDLAVNITSTPFRTGFPGTIWIDAYNDGCVPVTGEVRLVLDPFLTYNSSVPPPDTIIGDTLIWYVSNMSYDTPHFMAQVEVTVSTQAMIGDQICLDADISPKTNDNNVKNNVRDYCRPVINAYDPNDKQVSPQGVCAEGYVAPGEVFTYTVRFQNTGNADAINIFILDTLDTNLDMSSLKVVGQSHKPMVTEILPDRVLKFRFDNIHLPDSNTNEMQSHGYVMFEVTPLSNLAIRTVIENTAGIYFDFNEAVVTNTVRNTIIDNVPTQDTTFLLANNCTDYVLNGRTYTASGVYFQKFTGANSCDSVVSLSLSIEPLDTSVSIIGNTLTANEGGAHGLNATYQWVDCDNGNSPITGATNQSYTPETNGNYAVIISQGECSEMSACVNVSTVSIDKDFQAAIDYYPNPSDGSVKVDLGKYYSSVDLEIVNIVGQSISSENHQATDKLSLQLPEQAGFYFIRITAEGKTAVVRVLRN